MSTHLIDNFEVDAKSRRGIQATDFPLTCATNTKLLEIRRVILKRYNTKQKLKRNHWWKAANEQGRSLGTFTWAEVLNSSENV